MRDPNEPSCSDHNAPYNEDENGVCQCISCKHESHKKLKEEYLMNYGRERYDQ